jgi:glucose/arabinose dehydrogenase
MTLFHTRRLSAAVALLMLIGGSADAQQGVAFQGSIPVAPTGLGNQQLGTGPWDYHTAEQQDIRVEVLARDIAYPMASTFLDADTLLVVTRPGKIFRIADGKASEIAGGPASVFFGESGSPAVSHGYIDILPHPDFATNQLVYLSYTKPLGGDAHGLAIGRGRWNGKALEDFEDIWGGGPAINSSGRMAFGRDGKLYMTVSGEDPQDVATVGGKVIRLNDDGSIPADNPFVNTPKAKGEVYTFGHRNGLGLTTHPLTGAIWQSENGPNGGDEINILEPGGNYGWPLVSLGRSYSGPWQSQNGPSHAGYLAPVVYWMPAIAASGMSFYTGDAFPNWKGNLFVGALRTGEVPGTGHLERILLNENYEELRRESLLTDLHQRIRDVRQGPDGYLYLVTEEKAGAVLRIVPKK